jgi:alkylation response protein AidB-like acyl-CoA dehydrogenase
VTSAQATSAAGSAGGAVPLSGPLAYWPSRDTQDRRAALRDLLRKRHDPEQARAAILGDEPYDQDLWRRLVTDMGAAAILAPESLGGLGLGYEDFAVAVGELGRVLYTGPFFGSAVLALGALLAAADANLPGDTAPGRAAALAQQVASGEIVAALAFMDARGRWATGDMAHTEGPGPASDAVRAGNTGDGWRLTGHRHLVVNAPQAQAFCVTAATPDGPALFAVQAGEAVVTEVESIDPTRSLGTVGLDQAPADLLAHGEAARRAVDAAIRLAQLAMAAEGVGAAEEALRLMVSYAKSRHQFGRPIGGFQAIKHKCADALIAIEAARATVSYASWALDDGSPEADLAMLAAKIASTEAFLATAADCIQIHGTFGYTREAPSQSYFRRARWLSLFLGSAEDDAQLLAGLLGV